MTMNGFKPILKEAALNGVLSLLQRSEYRLNVAGIAYISLAAPIFLIALGFLSFSAYSAMLPLYGPTIALLLTGIGLLVITAICALIGVRILNKSKMRQQAAYSPEDLGLLIEAVLQDLEEDVSETVKSNPKMALATAVITGFVAGKGIQN